MAKRNSGEVIEMYRGYAIWSLTEANKSFYLAGQRANVNQLFRSVEAAEKHADYLIKTWQLEIQTTQNA